MVDEGQKAGDKGGGQEEKKVVEKKTEGNRTGEGKRTGDRLKQWGRS